VMDCRVKPGNDDADRPTPKTVGMTKPRHPTRR
jgi:hypothetical protein